jgi:hypothetical protein
MTTRFQLAILEAADKAAERVTGVVERAAT